MGRDVHEAVREACLWLPDAEEFLSHGSPNFRVRGKTFATFVVNHHGNGRVALWLNAPPGSQELHVAAEPENFFVPPYVGPRGWLGVTLDRDMAWTRVVALVREAYEKVAAAQLRRRIAKAPVIAAPSRPLAASEINPLQSPRAAAVLKKLRALCLALPESSEGSQFGHPTWLAGKKTFAMARYSNGRFTLNFWAGIERQGLLASDPRYHIPPYTGHQGWIALDVQEGCDWKEISGLARESYCHFALKRMLRTLSVK